MVQTIYYSQIKLINTYSLSHHISISRKVRVKMIYFKWILLLHYFTLVYTDDHSISKRYILFPRYSILQFTYGLSVPMILPSRSINLSWCLQSNFDYPYNLSNFNIMDLRSQESEFDMDRTTFYEYVINLLEGFGLNGEQCLLKSICEIAEVPMHLEASESLMEKIVHYLLTPSIDLSGRIRENNTLAQKVLVAEQLGVNSGKCDTIFEECDISIVDIFTQKFQYFN